MENNFSDVPVEPVAFDHGFLPMRLRTARKLLEKLKMDSSTGPDAVATRILKNCAHTLALPIALLARLVLDQQCWPSLWKVHWLIPLYKKRSVFDPSIIAGCI